jgi:anti-anti-sigma factor
VDKQRDAVVTSVKRSSALTDARSLKRHIMEHLREGRRIHVLDLTDLDTVDRGLMLTLLSLFRNTQRANGLFALAVESPEVLRSFAIAGLDGIIPIFSNVAQAVNAAQACARNPRDRMRARAIA